MLFEFKLKKKGLDELRPINNEIESTEDADSTTDESSIFDSIATNNSISVISEDNEEKKTSFRPISCYNTPPLSNESLIYQVFEKQPNRDLVKKNSWVGRSVSASLKKKEVIYKKNKSQNYPKDYEYSSINNETRRNEFCQSVENSYGDDTENSIIGGNKELDTLDSDNLEDSSFTSTSTNFHSQEAQNISCSTIDSNNRKPRISRQRQRFDQNTLKNRLSFLQPISSSMKIKIYISEKDEFEEVVVALKVQKEHLQDINELIDVIIQKIASQRSAIKRDNVKLYLLFKKESIRPIPLPMTPSETLNGSTLNSFDKTSLIMDYLSGRDKLYIRAVV